jgi:PAS domain-containing protein
VSETIIARSAIPFAAPSRPWRLWLGPILTVVVGVVIELLSLRSVRVPNPGVIYLAAIVGSIYLGGFGVGIASAVIALGMALVFFSMPGPLFHYFGEDERNLVTLLVATPLIMAMVGVLKRRDEQRVRERARMTALEQYRRMIEDFDAVAWERDPETLRVSFVSRPAEGLLGQPLDCWMDDGFWPERIHPDDRERALARFREVVRHGHGALEYRLLATGGRVVWVAIRCT